MKKVKINKIKVSKGLMISGVAVIVAGVAVLGVVSWNINHRNSAEHNNPVGSGFNLATSDPLYTSDSYGNVAKLKDVEGEAIVSSTNNVDVNKNAIVNIPIEDNNQKIVVNEIGDINTNQEVKDIVAKAGLSANSYLKYTISDVKDGAWLGIVTFGGTDDASEYFICDDDTNSYEVLSSDEIAHLSFKNSNTYSIIAVANTDLNDVYLFNSEGFATQFTVK